MDNAYREYLDFAVEIAYLAGRLTLGYFQTGIHPDMKSDNTPVTVADRKAEELIREHIQKKYPRHAVTGEELGSEWNEDASHRWVIDPIDGTKSFVRGIPIYSVLIGLEIEGKVEVGVAYFPALDEMLAAATGEGCWWNGRPAQVSEVSELKDAVVASGDIYKFAKTERTEAWDRVVQSTYFRPGWGDAYGHLLVATGRADFMLDPIMNVWDCAPFPPILKEAGGYFGDWNGNETIYGSEAISSNMALLPQVLSLVEEPSLVEAVPVDGAATAD